MFSLSFLFLCLMKASLLELDRALQISKEAVEQMSQEQGLTLFISSVKLLQFWASVFLCVK